MRYEYARPRGLWAGLILCTLMAGLASRHFDRLLPGPLHKNSGDILWATLVYFLFGLLFPGSSPTRVTLCASVFSAGIECSKFYHASWFEAVRDTVLGRLIFGYVFSWSNLVCYSVGIAVGTVVEAAALRRLHKPLGNSVL